jgi:probable F420-dependent oxidoreductase
MGFWLHIHNTAPEQMGELAVLAEDAGFEGVLGDDHWYLPAASTDEDPNARAAMPWDYIFPDPLVAGAAILARTRHLKYGTCVLVVANRANPLLVAKSVATVARTSEGRFVLGIGTGWMRDEYVAAGVDFQSRVARTVEMIDVLRKLWGPGPVQHHGRYFQFDATFAEPRPHQPVPIYLGGSSAPALRRAGRIADGWMGLTSELDALPGQIAAINEGRREAGRDREPFQFMCGLLPHPDGTLPTKADYRRSADLGITQHHFGPIEHVIGKQYPTFEEKRRVVLKFADRVIR